MINIVIVLLHQKEYLSFFLAVGLAFCLLLPGQLKAEEILIKPKIVLLPKVTQDQLCHALSVSKKVCGVDDQISYIRSFKQDNNKNLLFFYLKDNTNKYHKGLSVAARLDSNGQWKVGKAFVGEPQRIIRDAKGNLWVHIQYNNEGFSPHLLSSKNGLIWSEIHLPVKAQVAYTLEKINKLCIEDNSLFITLQAMSGDEKVVTSWKAKLSQLLIDPKNQGKKWQQLNKSAINALSCQPIVAKNNGWVIQEGETLTLLQHPAKSLIVKIVHESNAKNYALQVGAYKNLQLAHELVLNIQKAGFDTFSKMLTDGKGEKIKKVYAGPYSDRAIAAKKLAVLKARFAHNVAIQSAFILKFK